MSHVAIKSSFPVKDKHRLVLICVDACDIGGIPEINSLLGDWLVYFLAKYSNLCGVVSYCNIVSWLCLWFISLLFLNFWAWSFELGCIV